MQPGIYGIENSQNGLVYIGSANKMKRRLGTHRSNLRGGRHENQHLQHAYNLYGEDHFLFYELEPCDIATLISKEQEWMDVLGLDNLYNIRPFAERNIGVKFSKEARKKMSAAHKGKSLSKEHREGLSRAARIGKEIPFCPVCGNNEKVNSNGAKSWRCRACGRAWVKDPLSKEEISKILRKDYGERPNCPRCSSKKIWLTGHTPKRWRCDDCGKSWKMNNEKVKK